MHYGKYLALAALAAFGTAFADPAPRVDARHVPERMDDFIWENDCFGARTYGPKVSEPPPAGEGLFSSGFDVFNKAVPDILMAKTLIRGVREKISYHVFDGRAFDNYKVSTGRGCGGVGSLGPDGWRHEKNWRKCRVLSKTADEAVFELEYSEYTLRGTIRAGVHFCRFDILPKPGNTLQGRMIGPGLDISTRRQHNGNLKIDFDLGYIANFEPGAVGNKKNGNVCTAIILAGERPVLASDKMDCIYLLGHETACTYYAGAAWSGAGKFTRAEDWHNYVKEFAKGLKK